MRRLAVLLLCVVCLGCMGRSERGGGGGGGALVPDHQWKAQVLNSKDPVVVDFWATWCGPCQQMHPVMAALERDYKVMKVDVDANPSLTKRYQIQSIPAILIFKDGEVTARFEGVTSESRLRKELDQITKQ